MATPLSIAAPAVNGVNMADVPVVFNEKLIGSFLLNAVNLRIEDNRWRTSYRVRELKGCGPDLELWQGLFTQGAVWYLPAAGQGNTFLGIGNPRIVESAAGRLFTLEPKNDWFKVTDISGGKVSGPGRRIAWLCAAENYVFRTDGGSQTQIYDGKNPVAFSPGYNALAKNLSRFPNQAGPMVYAGGQMWVVIFGRSMIVSNSLHETDVKSAIDLTKFVDQTYDYINVQFAPPADDGNIVALCTSVNSGFQDSRAQGEVMAHCSGPSLWAVTLGIARTQWPTTQMRHSRSVEAAGTGPNAFFVRDGDVLMRTSKGIESVNLMARQQTTLGNPSLNLAAELKPLLSCDDEPSLLFASMVNPPKWDRLFCTVSPVSPNGGPGHYHLGWVSANWNPLNTRIPQGFAWEGVGALPYEMGRVVQFNFARIDGQSRLFAILDKKDGASKGLCEFTLEEGHNILADGTRVPIRWELLSKRLTPGGNYQTGGWGLAWLWLDKIKTDVQFKIYARSNVKTEFKELCSKCVEVLPAKDGAFPSCSMNGEKMVPLGQLFGGFSSVQWLQIWIVGTGVCSVDFAMGADAPEGAQEVAAKDLVLADTPTICQFDPFAYARPAKEVVCQP